MKYSDISLINHAKKLYPINRSLTGDGTRETLKYFEDFFPGLERLKFKTGEKVMDWNIPQEWNAREAYIEHIDSGRRYAEFSKLNLHLLGYSEPVDKVMSLDELKPYIYTDPDQHDAVPYVTSYYSRRWGFCMSQSDKDLLPSGLYHAVIDSKLEDGYLEMDHMRIKGESTTEIFFSSYVCHPSMLNNELSGPLVLGALIEYIQSKYPFPKKSYRFVLLPETIGSIAYISTFAKDLKKNVICGYNLSCVGDERAYSYVETPYANTLADTALSSALIGKDNVIKYSFLERGSDERQYCSPGLRLPICTFCRSKFGEYPEYHTSHDDFRVVTEEGLQGSIEVMKTIIDAFEVCYKPIARIMCEPQLGKRGLYPQISQKTSIGTQHPAEKRMNILAYCDGENTAFEISTITGISLKEVVGELEILMENNLVEEL